MNDKLPWMKLWFDDLDRDCGHLSPASYGAWVRILGNIRNFGGERSLTLEGWSRIIGASPEATSELLADIIFDEICDSNIGCDSEGRRHSSVTRVTLRDGLSQKSDALILIRNRRMVREHKARNKHALRQQRYRESKGAKPTCDAGVTVQEAEATEATEANKDTRTPKSAAISLPSVEAYQLSEKLRKAIQVRDPNAKAALLPDLTPWARDIDKLLRIDKRRIEDVLSVIEWCQKPECFWGPNILSGRKLRDKFDTMFGQMKQNGGKNAAGRQSAQGSFSGPAFNPADIPDYAK